MSRTLLTVLTALGLVVAAIAVMIGRYHVMGEEILVPRGPNTWKVTMKVNGVSLASNAKLQTLTPLDFGRQHIKREACRSDELLDKPPSARHPERRVVLWSQRPGVPPGPFHAYYEFYCLVDVHRPSVAMNRLAAKVDAAPAPGQQIKAEPRIECDSAPVAALARRLTAGHDDPGDQAEILFRYVDQEIANEPSPSGPGLGALDCLKNRRGDASAKSRLLVALCRNRGIPARLVMGVHLLKDENQTAHVWAEAWIHDHWLPMCAFNHHFGHVPPTYLVLGFGDQAVVRGKHVRDIRYAYLVERTVPEGAAAAEPTGLRRLLRQVSLDALQPAEQRMVEFLLLLPIAALIVCIGRNLVGVTTFGTFAPALVGLAFREVQSLPGILV
ncbi:MAG TPA: transglutaminase domain-containing protein, partial [Gemmataceae bacterium]|nr:transglutaminase domain-containing protein [Gemmataceae bacterium]